MNNTLRDELHRTLSTRMLIAGIDSPEQATDIAMATVEEFVTQAGKAILYDQKEIDHQLALMRRGYMRSTVLGAEEKSKHIAVETARITGVAYNGTINGKHREI